MTPLDRRVADLRREVDDIVHQFQALDQRTAHEPPADLTCSELRLVEYLGDQGPRMMRDIAEYVGLAVNTLTSTVDRLERRDLVRRERCEEDRRVVRVALTASGTEAYSVAVQAKLRFLRNMLLALTEEEQDIFMVLFRKIARAGRAQVRELTERADPAATTACTVSLTKTEAS
jgi:DNA-binding MarR family transcriptional regulator